MDTFAESFIIDTEGTHKNLRKSKKSLKETEKGLNGKRKKPTLDNEEGEKRNKLDAFAESIILDTIGSPKKMVKSKKSLNTEIGLIRKRKKPILDNEGKNKLDAVAESIMLDINGSAKKLIKSKKSLKNETGLRKKRKLVLDKEEGKKNLDAVTESITLNKNGRTKKLIKRKKSLKKIEIGVRKKQKKQILDNEEGKEKLDAVAESVILDPNDRPKKLVKSKKSLNNTEVSQSKKRKRQLLIGKKENDLNIKYDIFNKKQRNSDENEKHLTQFLFGTTANPEDNMEDDENSNDSITEECEQTDSGIDLSTGKKSAWTDEEDNIDLSTGKKSAWTDEEDAVKVKDIVKTYSKARGTRGNAEQSEDSYKEALEEKFSQVYGTMPSWAQLDRKIVDEEEEEENDMRKKTSVYLSQDEWGKLPKKLLAYKKVTALNKGSKEGKIISSIDFLSDLKIALVAGFTYVNFGVVTLFQFNGKENFKMKSVVFPKFPVKCAKFLPSKKQFVAGSNLFGRFFVYDIEKGKKIDIPCRNVEEKKSAKSFEISPDGKYIAFVLSGGQISFYDVNSLTHFESLQVPCETKAVAFSHDSITLYVTGSNGQVYVFDLIEWKCRHSFYDDGCIEGTAIAESPNGKILACGSSSGIINIYPTVNLSSSTNPSPAKVFGCLVTPVTCLAFNSTSEILAVASNLKENAIKLIHTGSMTVFANFPGAHVFKRIQTINFSPDSKYLVMGDNNETAHLHRLLYY